ncbi:MAG TPA: hypothetical protein VGO04_23205 [Ensifer sp.]|uniref:hypothetical protein n=1 Tax=Ensifer sp. TaxID=1872086 RepID=UPI002E1029CE|nr:hypothetical protein [Ensifer sp.]
MLVAVPTLIYLKRQIHDAKEAAQSAFALQNYGNVVLCHKLLRDSRMLQEEVIIQRLVWGPAPSEQPRSIETAIDTVSQLRESLAIKSFLQFEDAIGYPKDLNFVDVGSILDMAEATIRRAPSPLNGDEARAIDRSVREMYDVIERYVADCIHAAKSYISDTDRIAGVHGFHPRATILENWPL